MGAAAALLAAVLALSGCGQADGDAPSCELRREVFIDGPGDERGAETPLDAAQEWLRPGESAAVTARERSSREVRSVTVTLTDSEGALAGELRLTNNGHGWVADRASRCAGATAG